MLIYLQQRNKSQFSESQKKSPFKIFNLRTASLEREPFGRTGKKETYSRNELGKRVDDLLSSRIMTPLRPCSFHHSVLLTLVDALLLILTSVHEWYDHKFVSYLNFHAILNAKWNRPLFFINLWRVNIHDLTCCAYLFSKIIVFNRKFLLEIEFLL